MRKSLNRRRFLHQCGLVATGLAVAPLAHAMTSRSGGPPPNVVVIVSDDHRWDAMSHAGNAFIQTPHLDAMAANGIRFSNAYASSGVCSPSRATILTGKHAHRAGTPNIIWNNHSFLENETPFPARLRRAGYQTAHIGKWHLGKGAEPKPGYDYWAGFDFLGAFHNPRITINGVEKPFEGYVDDVLADLAAQYIQRQSDATRPFCLFLGLKAPHHPYAYPARYTHAFADVTIPKPENYDEDYAESGRPDFWNDCAIRMEAFHGGIPQFGDYQNLVKSYYKATLAIDDAVGRVNSALKAAGVWENTIVLYTSDQGYSLGEHGLMEKHFAYEEAARVPMLLQFPRAIPANVTRNQLALTNDIAPTVLDLCGLEIPEEMDGLSWKPLIESENPKWRDAILFHQWSPGKAIAGMVAVRDRRYKYIRFPYIEGDYHELYDLQLDPRENQNLADKPAFAQIVKRMRKKLENKIEDTNLLFSEYYRVDTAWLLGPFTEEEAETVRTAAIRGRAPAGHRWKKLEAPSEKGFDLSGLKGRIFIALPVEKRTDYDPHLEVHLTPRPPFTGYTNGNYTDHITPQATWAERYNPPLTRRHNLLVLETEVPETGFMRIDFHAPPKALQLSSSIKRESGHE